MWPSSTTLALPAAAAAVTRGERLGDANRALTEEAADDDDAAADDDDDDASFNRSRGMVGAVASGGLLADVVAERNFNAAIFNFFMAAGDDDARLSRGGSSSVNAATRSWLAFVVVVG
jgi:hypothetical protein